MSLAYFFNTAKLFQCFSFRDVRTSEIKLHLNNAAGGRLYFMRPHSAHHLFQFYFTMCNGLNSWYYAAYFNAAILYGEVQRCVAFFIVRLYIVGLVVGTMTLS